ENPQNPSSDVSQSPLPSSYETHPLETRRRTRIPELADSLPVRLPRLPAEASQRAAIRYRDVAGSGSHRRGARTPLLPGCLAPHPGGATARRVVARHQSGDGLPNVQLRPDENDRRALLFRDRRGLSALSRIPRRLRLGAAMRAATAES